MPSNMVLYIFGLLILLYLHLGLQTLNAISLNINRQNEWNGIVPLEHEATRLEAFKSYTLAIYRALMGKEAPHQGAQDLGLGAVDMYGGYPQADEAGDPFFPAWQGDMGYDDAVPMPDMVEVIEPHAGRRRKAWQRNVDSLRRRFAFGRR